MIFQLSDTLRNAALDALEVAAGAAPVLTLRTGAPPTNCAAANAGTVIATMTLPTDWLSAASGGLKQLAGSWQDPAADAGGTVGHFRIHQGGVCHMQGDVTITGGGGMMTLDNPTLTVGQLAQITAFNIAAGGA